MKRIVKKLAQKSLGDVYDRLVLPKHFAVGIVANLRRGLPARNLKVIGVTGTNGKTSTCFLIHAMLAKAGYKTGLMTSVAWGLNDQITPQITHMTSQPIQITLDRIMTMRKKGLDWLVLEVTSQALAQFRTMGIPIDIAVMTNVTHEHLDYHKTFERYLKAKLRLFKHANRNRKGRRLGIVNSDDTNVASFVDAIEHVVAYSTADSAGTEVAYPTNLKLTASGSQYTFNIKDDSYKITCNLPGRFNVENSLAAVLVARAVGLKKKEIEAGIASLKQVEGRMTSIEAGQPFAVLVDFAHTPDSFKKLFEDMRPLVKGKLIALFGSAGRRDKIKRAIQGKIAGEYADLVILTEEDDRDEDGMAILKQIAKGATKAGKTIDKDLFLILDRQTAIKKACLLAKNKTDLVLLLGKGHEKTIERADGEHPWDEIGFTQQTLQDLFKTKTKSTTTNKQATTKKRPGRPAKQTK